MKTHCCKDFKYHANYKCEPHDDPWECPDYVIAPLGERKWCLPIRDGGSSGIVFDYCPWCGAKLKSPHQLGFKISQ